MLPLSDAACSFMTLDSENFPSAPALLCHVHNLCSKDMRKTFCHSPRCFFCWKDSNRSWNGSNSRLPPAIKFIENMIYLQAPADPMWVGHVAATLDSITCMGSAIVIKWKWDKGHLKAKIFSECRFHRDVNAIKSITLTASLPSWCSVDLCDSWLTSCLSVNLPKDALHCFSNSKLLR